NLHLGPTFMSRPDTLMLIVGARVNTALAVGQAIRCLWRARAITPDCLWMMPRDPDADMCRRVQATLQSTEECVALQSYVRRRRFSDGSKATAREICRRESRDDSQFGGPA